MKPFYANFTHKSNLPTITINVVSYIHNIITSMIKFNFLVFGMVC